MGFRKTRDDFFGGDLIVKGFLLRYLKFFLCVAFVSLVYIANRYYCRQQLATINALHRQIKDAKFEALTRQSELLGRCKESQIENLINDKGLELEMPQQPPFILSK